MSVNTTSSPNVSTQPFNHECFFMEPGSTIFVSFTVTNTLFLVPVSVLVLSVGFRRWRRQSGGVMANPADVFTYNMIVMEAITICSAVICSLGSFADQKIKQAGVQIFFIVSCMKMYFHVLTCIERYLAVVHPVTYLSLNKTSGITIRNISVGCVWGLAFGLVPVRVFLDSLFTIILFFCNLVFSLIVMCFCSVLVLRVLNRPGPGDDGGKGQKVDKSKQRAFVTITVIMAVLVLRCGGNLVCMALANSSMLSNRDRCAAQVTGVWFSLPSSYVLPMQFLHRAGRLVCFKNNFQSQ